MYNQTTIKTDNIFGGSTMSPAARQRLLELFKSRAVACGHFKLASGKESTYYINSKKALFHSEAVALLGEALWDLTKNLNIQAIGGLEVGAIPMATAAVLRYFQEGRELEGFFVRKQAKGHGATVAAVICIVDRLQGARELLATRYNYQPIFTIRDFGIEPPAV
jgi:orotate phosphoribosyltransferase